MRLDALTLELLRNYLHGAVEDMAYAVERTAHTTFVKETADFTCGLLNPSGEFFAYPVELGVASMAGINYARTIESVGPLGHGDVIITNDPYSSLAAATHLPDLHLVRPIFWEGRLVAHGGGVSPLLGHRRAGAGEHLAEGQRDLPGGIAPAAEEALRGRPREPGSPRRDPGELPDPRAELGRPPGAGRRPGDGRAAGPRADRALRDRRGRQGDGRPDRLHRAQGRGAHPPDAARPLRVHRLHRGRRRHRHPHPAQGGDDGGRRPHPSRLHGQRRAGGLGAERADGRARPSVHGHRAVQLLHHRGPGHPAERRRAAPDPDDAPRGLGGEPAVPRGVRRALRHRAPDLRRRAGRARPRAARRRSPRRAGARAAWSRSRCPTSRPGAGTSP